MVGVQDEQDVERALDPGVGLVLQLGHLVHHREEVAGVAQVVVRIDVRLAHVVPVREGGERRHLREHPDDLDVAEIGVLHLDGVGVERGQGAGGREQHPHRVRVIAEALHEALDVLVDEGVDGHLVRPLVQLLLRRQRAVDEEVGDLEVRRVLAELLDRVAAVLEDACVAVDVRDRRTTRGRVRVRRVVGHEAEIALVDLHLPEVHGTYGPVGDRDLERLARAVVRDGQRLTAGGGAVARPLLSRRGHATSMPQAVRVQRGRARSSQPRALRRSSRRRCP